MFYTLLEVVRRNYTASYRFSADKWLQTSQLGSFVYLWMSKESSLMDMSLLEICRFGKYFWLLAWSLWGFIQDDRVTITSTHTQDFCRITTFIPMRIWTLKMISWPEWHQWPLIMQWYQQKDHSSISMVTIREQQSCQGQAYKLRKKSNFLCNGSYKL